MTDKQSRSVFLSPEAEADIEELYLFLQRREGMGQAEDILARLEAAVMGLGDPFSERGNIPPELQRVGVKNFREIHVPPWRIIYEVASDAVYVHWVFDSRRNVAGQLEQRLLRR